MFEKLKILADTLEQERWRQDEVYYWMADHYQVENKDHSYFEDSSKEKAETKANLQVLENQNKMADHHMLKDLEKTEANKETTFCNIISDKPEIEPTKDIEDLITKPKRKRKSSFKTSTLKTEWRSMRHFNGFI
jgi:hypothetical protein